MSNSKDDSPILLLVGCGSVASSIINLANECGFIVDVVDDREAFVENEKFSLARNRIFLPEFAGLVEACSIGSSHYVIIATHSKNYDCDALYQSLESKACYIGLAGNKAKKEEIFATLRSKGIPNAELKAIHCPIGLPIRPKTASQLAVAIVGELLAAKAGILQRLRLDKSKQN